jgi:hypothetical protein
VSEEIPQFARVTRLDPARLVDRLAEEAGVRLELEGHGDGGQVGAAYVRWPDGHRSVLTYVPGVALTRARETARNVEFARRAGVPAPRYELVADLGDEVAIVQELLPGRPPQTIDVGLIDEMLAVNRRLYGLLAGTDFAAVPLHLTEGGQGFCQHEPLQAYSARSRRLLDWIREVGRTVPPTMIGDDLVHGDYHPGNVLVGDDGVLSGVVDWIGAARGDARWTGRFGISPTHSPNAGSTSPRAESADRSPH